MNDTADHREVVDLAIDHELQELIASSSSLAFRVAYAVLRDREDAEDVAQEAFLRAHRRSGALREQTRFRAWLVRICWRLALDRQRSNRRRLRRDAATFESPVLPSIEDVAVANDLRSRLQLAIDGLPEKLRLTLVLAALEGYEVREVAGLLGVPEGTIKSRLFLARKRLKEVLS
jgi:RNA polymerase sigma-70 factor, ECF subfamily